MKRFLRTLKIEVGRGILSRRFLAALPLPLLFYLMSGGEELFQLWNSTYIDCPLDTVDYKNPITLYFQNPDDTVTRPE